jgi:hypothetical protein
MFRGVPVRPDCFGRCQINQRFQDSVRLAHIPAGFRIKSIKVQVPQRGGLSFKDMGDRGGRDVSELGQLCGGRDEVTGDGGVVVGESLQ